MARHQRGGVALSVFLPGAPQLLAGRVAEGLLALTPWVSAVLLLVLRADFVSSQLGEASAVGRASMVLLAAAGLAWAWSLRDVSTPPEPGAVQGVWMRILRDPWAGVGLAILLFFAGLSLVGPPLLLTEDAGRTQTTEESFLRPSIDHPMGTDNAKADVFERFLSGARVTLGIGVFGGLGGALVGVTLGAWAGFTGGWTDRLLMRFVDFFIALPKLVLLIALAALYDLGAVTLALFIAFVQWPALARIVRAEAAALAQREFVHALRAFGMSESRILFRHVLPNAQGVILVGTALAVANALLIEAGLSFLGLGVDEASWGRLIKDGSTLIPHWWVGGFAGISLVLVVVALNLVADAVRDVFDPRADVSA